LNIRGCPKLKECKEITGEEWDKIADIPKFVYWNEEEDIFEIIYVKLVIFV